MTAHTNPVAFHLLSSYIAAGLVPQIPGNASLIPSQTSYDPLNPSSNIPNTPGIGFQSIANLMTTSAATNILHSQSIASGLTERNAQIDGLSNQELNRTIISGKVVPTQSGFSTNLGLHMNMSSSGISSVSNKTVSNDIKRPIPHLPQKSSGIGIS